MDVRPYHAGIVPDRNDSKYWLAGQVVKGTRAVGGFVRYFLSSNLSNLSEQIRRNESEEQ
jgi:hypothetical protein